VTKDFHDETVGLFGALGAMWNWGIGPWTNVHHQAASPVTTAELS